MGEPVYGDNWWLTGGSSADAKAADPSGEEDGGNGSAYFGTLAQWKAAMPSARVLAGGFSLGSGVKGDGVLRSQTYGDQQYVFTDENAVVTPPAQTPKNVAGSSTFKKGTRSVSVTVKADALGANQTEANKLVWKITVDGSPPSPTTSTRTPPTPSPRSSRRAREPTRSTCTRTAPRFARCTSPPAEPVMEGRRVRRPSILRVASGVAETRREHHPRPPALRHT